MQPPTNEEQILLELDDLGIDRAVWHNMSDDEKSEVFQILAEMHTHGHSNKYHQLSADIWDHPFPDIRTILEDPYYLGGIGGGDLFPCLVEDMQEVFTNPRIHEVVLTGAIGWGKTFFAALGMAIEVLFLLHLREPQVYCGAARNTKLSIVNMSVTADNAAGVLYDKVFQFLKACPWMQDHYPVDDRTGLYFKDKNIHFRPGSSSEMAVIGEDLIGAALDEVNFMIGARRSRRAIQAGEIDVAAILYNAIARRRISRFPHVLTGEVVVPARMWLISSKQFPGDFLERRMDEIREALNRGLEVNTHIVEYAQWETRMSLPEDQIPYCGRWFTVLYGDALHMSRVLTPDDVEYESQDEALASHYDDCPDGCELIAVPVEYRTNFVADMYGALRDIAGRATLATNPYFTDTTSFSDAICRKDCGDISRVHPYRRIETDIVNASMFDISKIPVTYEDGGKPRPFLNPGAPRFAHFDQSVTTDATGFSICHFGGYKEKTIKVPESYIDEDGKYRERFVDMVEKRPIIIIDFMIRVLPPKGGRIDLDNLRVLLYTFKVLSGISNFHSVTYDQFESESQIAALVSEGYNAHRFSVDKKSVECYGLLRAALSDRRLSCYEYGPLAEDLASMERTPKGKIDHRPGGTKDVADTVAANVYKIEEEYKRIRLPMFGDAGRDPVEENYQKDFRQQVRGGPDPEDFDPFALIDHGDMW